MELHFKKIVKNCVAATSIEYSLLAVILAIAAIIGFESLGLNILGLFDAVNSSYENREGFN